MVPPYIQHPNGDIFYNELADFVKGCFITCGNATITVPVATATAPGRSPEIIFESSNEAFTEIFSLIIQKAYSGLAQNLRVLITDVSNRRRLMNRDIPVDHVFGSNLHPGELDESLLLRPQQILLIQFFNYDTSNAAVLQPPVLECRKFQQGCLQSKKTAEYLLSQLERKLFLTPYWVGNNDQLANLSVVPAGGQKINFFNVTNDIDLVVTKSMGSFNLTAGDLLVSYLDAATERPLQNQPVEASCAFGNAQFPYVFPCAWPIQRNTKATVIFTDNGASGGSGFLTLQGVAAFQGQVPSNLQ